LLREGENLEDRLDNILDLDRVPPGADVGEYVRQLWGTADSFIEAARSAPKR
jgi:hypothetical protein